jgi:hypothetical protein
VNILAKQVDRKIGFFETVLTLGMGLFSLGIVVVIVSVVVYAIWTSIF